MARRAIEREREREREREVRGRRSEEIGCVFTRYVCDIALCVYFEDNYEHMPGGCRISISSEDQFNFSDLVSSDMTGTTGAALIPACKYVRGSSINSTKKAPPDAVVKPTRRTMKTEKCRRRCQKNNKVSRR
jgi:hypothetical protein